ncbi:MAG: hypothetical protein J1D86_06335 [Alistipes sp.]|nr:hypothetical protein [Alistipes sp.]
MNDEKSAIIISMLEELITQTKRTSQSQNNLARPDELTTQMQQAVVRTDTLVARLESLIGELKQPTITERRYTFNLESKPMWFFALSSVIVVSVLSAALYFARQPDYDRIDNDLKYRYIKMKGEATPQQIAELEDMFELHRDNTRIRELHRTVTKYEHTLRTKIALEEQTRLKQQEVELLDNKVNEMKGK